MSAETGEDAALLEAISELRRDVNRLIDEQLARVRAFEEARLGLSLIERRYNDPVAGAPTTPAPPREPAGARRREPVQEPATSASDDPSLRLDALARHLDGRLRRSNGRTKPGQGDGSERIERGSNGHHGSTSEASP